MDAFIAEDFTLQSGTPFPGIHIAYKTHGQLNAARDNAILFPSWFGVPHETVEWIIGPGRPLDPRRYFIIAVSILGNGRSSWPSNSPAPFDRARFPLTTLLDNVLLQRRMVAELWGIEAFRAVIGRSMGAQIALQWGALFPEMVPRLLALCGSARTAAHNYGFLDTISKALLLDPAYRDGKYDGQRAGGLDLMRTIYDSWVVWQTYYRQGLHLTESTPTTRAYLDRPQQGPLRDANDVLAQQATWQNADINANPRFNGDFEAALGAILHSSNRASPICSPADMGTMQRKSCLWRAVPLQVPNEQGRRQHPAPLFSIKRD